MIGLDDFDRAVPRPALRLVPTVPGAALDPAMGLTPAARLELAGIAATMASHRPEATLLADTWRLLEENRARLDRMAASSSNGSRPALRLLPGGGGQESAT